MYCYACVCCPRLLTCTTVAQNTPLSFAVLGKFGYAGQRHPGSEAYMSQLVRVPDVVAEWFVTRALDEW